MEQFVRTYIHLVCRRGFEIHNRPYARLVVFFVVGVVTTISVRDVGTDDDLDEARQNHGELLLALELRTHTKKW